MLATEFSDKLRKRFEELQGLRDELRVRVHLGGLEARKLWDQIEERFTQMEHQALQASSAATEDLSRSLDKLSESLKDLRSQLKEKPH